MITLTTAHQVNSVLGGTTPIGYNHQVLAPFTMNPVTRRIEATLRLTSISNPEMDVISGALVIALGPATLVIKVDQLDFQRRVQLSAGQINAVQTVMNNAQHALESGLITIGVVAGVPSPGA